MAVIDKQSTNSSGHVKGAGLLAPLGKLLLLAGTPLNQKTDYPRPIRETDKAGIWVWSVRPEVRVRGRLPQPAGTASRNTPDALTREWLGAAAAQEVAQRLVAEMRNTFQCEVVALVATNAGNRVASSARADALRQARKLGLDVLVEFEVRPRSSCGAPIEEGNVYLETQLAGAASIRRVSDNATLWRSLKLYGCKEIVIPCLPGTRAQAQPVLHAAADNVVDNWMISFRPGKSLLQLFLKRLENP